MTLRRRCPVDEACPWRGRDVTWEPMTLEDDADFEAMVEHVEKEHPGGHGALHEVFEKED